MVPVDCFVVGEERNTWFGIARGEFRFDGGNIKGTEGGNVAVVKRFDVGSAGGGGSQDRGDGDVDVGGAVGEPAEFGVEFLWGEGQV